MSHKEYIHKPTSVPLVRSRNPLGSRGSCDEPWTAAQSHFWTQLHLAWILAVLVLLQLFAHLRVSLCTPFNRVNTALDAFTNTCFCLWAGQQRNWITFPYPPDPISLISEKLLVHFFSSSNAKYLAPFSCGASPLSVPPAPHDAVAPKQQEIIIFLIFGVHWINCSS